MTEAINLLRQEGPGAGSAVNADGGARAVRGGFGDVLTSQVTRHERPSTADHAESLETQDIEGVGTEPAERSGAEHGGEVRGTEGQRGGDGEGQAPRVTAVDSGKSEGGGEVEDDGGGDEGDQGLGGVGLGEVGLGFQAVGADTNRGLGKVGAEVGVGEYVDGVAKSGLGGLVGRPSTVADGLAVVRGGDGAGFGVLGGSEQAGEGVQVDTGSGFAGGNSSGGGGGGEGTAQSEGGGLLSVESPGVGDGVTFLGKLDSVGIQGSHAGSVNTVASVELAAPGDAAPVPVSVGTGVGAAQVGVGVGAQGAGASSEVDGLDSNQNVARVVRGLRGIVNQNGGSVTIRLDPPELGAVRIEMQMDRGVVAVSLQSDQESVRTLLSHQLGQLRHLLETQGLSVDRLQVQPPSHGSVGFSSEQDAERAPEDGRSRGRHGGRGGSGSGEGDPALADQEAGFDHVLNMIA